MKVEDIVGVSYIGKPKSNTAMYISKKIEDKLCALENVRGCLVFAEQGISPSKNLLEKHNFQFSEKPQSEYALFVKTFAAQQEDTYNNKVYKQMPGGYFVGEDVSIGENSFIAPGCVIGHGVIIGKNARLLAGTVIHYARIGDGFMANEHAVIGANGFTMVDDEKGNRMRIPTLGGVIIGDNVEVGAHNNISRGSAGDTIIDNNVKLDALVHVGHDAHIGNNVEVTSGVIIGGFVEIGEESYVGINAALRNRITIGSNTTIGMGATVTKSVDGNRTVVGNPARTFDPK